MTDREEKVVSMRKDGKSYREIVAATGMATSTIADILGKYGLRKKHVASDGEIIHIPTMFAEHKPIIPKRVVERGKSYLDITECFMSMVEMQAGRATE